MQEASKAVSRRQGDLFPELISDKKYLSDYPELAAEYHPTKNGTKLPEDYTFGSGEKVWWVCSVDSSHEWRAVIGSRIAGTGCPYCSGNLPSNSYNFAVAHPNLVSEWHPTRNNKKPTEYTPKSNLKVWWQCRSGHEWQTAISHRSAGGGCPKCFRLNQSELARPKATEHFNLLAENPTVCIQWDYERNQHPPNHYLPGSGAVVWWKCNAEDDHRWQARISSRVGFNDKTKNGCPFCAGRKPSKKYNLLTKYPNVAKEWHHLKNKKQPYEYTPYSNRSVWWSCEKGHEWVSSIGNRTKGRGCPTCSNKSSRNEIRLFIELKAIFGVVQSRHKIGGHEADIFVPEYNCAVEYDGSYWHSKSLAKDKSKQTVVSQTGVVLLRVRETPLPKITEKDIFVNPSKPLSKEAVEQVAMQIANNDERVIRYLKLSEFANEEMYRTYLDYFPSPFPDKSLAYVKPQLAAEWHPTKNSPLLPINFSASSSQRVWWQCKHGHEWEAKISNRTKRNCPYCAGRYPTKESCMKSTHPHLAEMFHPIKNGKLTPFDLKAGTHKKLWWRCTKNSDHEWQRRGSASVNIKGNNYCPICVGLTITDDNCMAATHPHLADIFHPNKNGDITPYNIKAGTAKKLWWRCLKDKAHEWQLSGSTMKIPRKSGYCPHCAGRR